MLKMRKNFNKRVSHKRSVNKLTKKEAQRGGNNGRYVMPQTYFGNGSNGYYPSGSLDLNSSSNQHAVSQGVLSRNGKFAGPNLYPMLGGESSCSGKRNMKKNNNSRMRGGYTKYESGDSDDSDDSDDDEEDDEDDDEDEYYINSNSKHTKMYGGSNVNPNYDGPIDPLATFKTEQHQMPRPSINQDSTSLPVSSGQQGNMYSSNGKPLPLQLPQYNPYTLPPLSTPPLAPLQLSSPPLSTQPPLSTPPPLPPLPSLSSLLPPTPPLSSLPLQPLSAEKNTYMDTTSLSPNANTSAFSSPGANTTTQANTSISTLPEETTYDELPAPALAQQPQKNNTSTKNTSTSTSANNTSKQSLPTVNNNLPITGGNLNHITLARKSKSKSVPKYKHKALTKRTSSSRHNSKSKSKYNLLHKNNYNSLIKQNSRRKHMSSISHHKSLPKHKSSLNKNKSNKRKNFFSLTKHKSS